jgi:hypothetical protein
VTDGRQPLRLVEAAQTVSDVQPLSAVQLAPSGQINRIYEDASLHPAEEKRADSDRVISFLQATGVLPRDTLARTKRLWRTTGRQEKLWRVLLRTEEIAEDLIFEAAAVSHGFARVDVSLLETIGLIDHLSKKWPASVMPRLIGLGILPIVPSAGRTRPGVLTFAAYDPTRPEVRRMLETVSQDTYTLRYVSRTGVEECARAVSDFLPGVLPGSIKTIGTTRQAAEITNRKAA